MRRGADHYGDRNWEKGIPFQRCLASLYRHIVAWQLGKNDEDHLGNAAFNLMALMHYENYAALGADEGPNTDISEMDDTQRDSWYGYQDPTV